MVCDFYRCFYLMWLKFLIIKIIYTKTISVETFFLKFHSLINIAKDHLHTFPILYRFFSEYFTKMSTKCNILFENPKEVYYSGEMLRGTIYLTLTAPSMTMPSPPNLPDSNITSFHSMVRCLPIFICFIHFENIYACFFLSRSSNLWKSHGNWRRQQK